MPGGPTFDEEQLLHLTDRAEWREWLQEHYRSAREAWLVSFKVHTGKPSISYNDQVEEALCFGWIDSIGRRVDEDRFARRFTPRRPGSPYSEANKARLRALVRERRVMPEVLETLGDVLGHESGADDLAPIPEDIAAALKMSPPAWDNLQGFSPAYVRIRIGYIQAARNRPGEFAKRLRHLVAMTAKAKQFGYGGIEKHY
jgi:uncharacterized protein YdeI (YjbR/CyaY-like superfamily)